MPGVTIIRDRRFVRGWPDEPGKPIGERVYLLPLARALTRSYSCDAHFAQYVTPNSRRLKKDALASGVTVEMTCVAFDIDDLVKHGSGEPARGAWRAELRAKMSLLWQAHPGVFYYETRGGARIVYTLPTPVILRSREDDRKWSQQYAVALAYFSRRFNIDADQSCADWTRLFRLPHVTREPGAKPEAWPSVGDPNRVGALHIEASSEDVTRARKASRAFDGARTLDFTPCYNDGQGLLYHLLLAQGALVRPHGGNAYVIRCPNEQQHTSGCTGDGSTLLYMPAAGREIGAIHCLHQHCQDLRVRDWLRFYSDVELDFARRSAGIVKATTASRHRARVIV